jgi:polar amino acid transport system substrate-binding protein
VRPIKTIQHDSAAPYHGEVKAMFHKRAQFRFLFLAAVAIVLTAWSSVPPPARAQFLASPHNVPGVAALSSPLPPETVQSDDLLDQVLAAGKLVVSTDPNYAPWSFINDHGELDGFDVDVAKQVTSRLGVDLEFATPQWDLIVAGHWGGLWDVSIGSMTPTDERAQVLWFTDPYYYVPGAFAIHQDNTTFTTGGQLAGKQVGVGTGTPYEAYLEGHLDPGNYGWVISYPPPSGIDIHSYSSDAEGIQDLALGDGVRLDAVMTSKVAIQNAIDQGVPLKYLGTSAFSEPAVFALDQDRSPADQMIAALNAIIAAMRDDGTLANISIKWLGIDISEPGPLYQYAFLPFVVRSGP